jgi:hypothetical protein
MHKFTQCPFLFTRCDLHDDFFLLRARFQRVPGRKFEPTRRVGRFLWMWVLTLTLPLTFLSEKAEKPKSSRRCRDEDRELGGPAVTLQIATSVVLFAAVKNLNDRPTALYAALPPRWSCSFFLDSTTRARCPRSPHARHQVIHNQRQGTRISLRQSREMRVYAHW